MSEKINLSLRLQKIASLVDKGAFLGDIGADHGYLVSYLAQEEMIQKGIAIENKKGPYLRLQENIHLFHLDNQIEVSLSNGLNALPDYIDTIVIAGMGGDLIIDIFKANEDKLKNLKQIIVSPHSNLFEVRSYLVSKGFYIDKEADCFDPFPHYYQMISFKKGHQNYSLLELKYGPLILKNKSQDLSLYLTKQKENLLLLKKKDLPLVKINQITLQIAELEQIIASLN
jgi:tRNA (adenine22-N1)-methyltransferase